MERIKKTRFNWDMFFFNSKSKSAYSTVGNAKRRNTITRFFIKKKLRRRAVYILFKMRSCLLLFFFDARTIVYVTTADDLLWPLEKRVHWYDLDEKIITLESYHLTPGHSVKYIYIDKNKFQILISYIVSQIKC